MKFKSVVLAMALALPFTVGCARDVKSTTPTAALAPGYNSTTDQSLGQSLAAVNAFVKQEKVNYAALPPSQQLVEKSYLNTLIDSTNLANATYTAYHQGTGTFDQAQAAYKNASAAQAALIANKGVK
jgi:hypothetical protein